MASTIKVTNIDTPDGTGNITVDRPLSGSGASLTALNATELTSGTIPIARIADDAVTTAKIAPDAITAAKIADDVINSEHYAAGSIDLEHMSSQSVDEDNLHISNAGTNGQFLSKQSGNAGGLTWADDGGVWEYMSTSTTGSSRAFNNVFSFYNASPNWPAYMFVMDLACDNNGGGLGIRFYNSSNTLVTSGYKWNCAVLNSNASTWTIGNSNSDSYIKCSTLPANAAPLWCTVIVRYANGRQVVEADTMWNHTQGSNYFGRSVAGGMLYNSNESSGIQFTMHSGVLQGGNIFMYRLNKS